MKNFKNIYIFIMCSMLLVSIPTTHVNAQAAQVVKSISKIFGKKAAKELAEETAEQVAKEAAQGVAKKAGKEIAEETAEQAIKRLSKEAAETVIKKNATNALFQSSQVITKNVLSEVAPTAIKNTLFKQLSKELGENALKTTSKEFAQQVGKSASHEVGEQFIKRLGTESSQEALELSSKSSIKSLKDEALEQTNNLKKQVQKPLSNKITKVQQKALQQLGTIADDINKFKKSKDVSSKAEALLEIKRKLDNAPELPEKQKIFDALPNDIKSKLERMWGGNYKYDNIPATAKGQGRWTGERGNSNYIFDVKKKPKSNQNNNLRNLSMEDIITENNLQDGIKYVDGYPDLSPYSIANVEVDFGDVLKGVVPKKYRNKLQDEAFEKLAKQMNRTVDEVKVMKGHSDAAQRLAKQWGCSEDEVFKRCGNPNRRLYTWHEEPDCKTLRLVPTEIHANLNHNGGIEMFKILNNIL